MIYLQARLKVEKIRNLILIATGKIAKAVGPAIAQFLDGIIIYIREGLARKAASRGSIDEILMLECISMLSLAVGQSLSKYIEGLLDPIFAYGLSKSLA